MTVDVVLKEDQELNKLIKKTSKKLKTKFSKTRKVNEELLKPVHPVLKAISIFFNVFFIFLSVFCCFIGVSSFLLRLNNLPPTFAGYSVMTIATDSMVADGFDVGNTIVIKRTNPKSLNVGDNIAFYLYEKSYNEFYSHSTTLVNKPKTDHQKIATLSNFLGLPTKEIKEAAKHDSKKVFHKIIRIYEDENGNYWFKTKGASNEDEDPWYVSEKMLIGVHTTSKGAHFFEGFLTLISYNIYALLIIVIPLIIVAAGLLIKSFKRVQITKLELDCVEEKRKITDEICIKNNVGFNMDNQTKYKILAQAPPDLKPQYISLLWKDGSAPNSIRKYVIRKKFILKPMEEMLVLNRECEKMFNDGVKLESISKHYIKRKKEIENKMQNYKNILKKLKDKNKTKSKPKKTNWQ